MWKKGFLIKAIKNDICQMKNYLISDRILRPVAPAKWTVITNHSLTSIPA